jgi:hypothetical protein
MTTDNQNLSPIEETTYSKASSVGRTPMRAAASKSTPMKTLSLRPTRSVKKNNSLKPLATRKLK